MPGPASRLCARKSKGARSTWWSQAKRWRHTRGANAMNWKAREFGVPRGVRRPALGTRCLTERAYPARKESLGIGLFARGGKAQLRSMEVWPMTPISPGRMTS
jgi:hypothetical protein